MAEIKINKTAAAGVETPLTDRVSIFVDSADDKLKYKDDANTVSVVASEDYVSSWYMLNTINYFWDWSDWDVTISWSVTLTRDMYYNNLTINTWNTLIPNGYRIFVKWTLSWDWAITLNWNAWDDWTTSWTIAVWANWATALNAWTLNAVRWWTKAWTWYSYNGTPPWTNAATAAEPTIFWYTTNGSITRWNFYNKLLTLADFVWYIWSASSLYFYPYKVWAQVTWWDWHSQNSSNVFNIWWSWWGWGSGWLIWLAVNIMNFTWTITANWWAWWAWNSVSWSYSDWGNGWNWWHWWVIYLIYHTLTSLWTTSVVWWAWWAAWTWQFSNWVAWAAWSEWAVIQIPVI